jgi:PST family polysaccharide transporter
MMQSVGTTVGSIYLSTGNPGIALRVSLIGAPVLIAGMAGGLPWGIHGVAVGYALASFSLFYYTAVTAFRLIGLSLPDFYLGIARPFISTLVMLSTMMLSGVFTSAWLAPMRLGIGIALGMVTYLLASLAVNRAQLVELLAVVRVLRPRQ